MNLSSASRQGKSNYPPKNAKIAKKQLSTNEKTGNKYPNKKDKKIPTFLTRHLVYAKVTGSQKRKPLLRKGLRFLGLQSWSTPCPSIRLTTDSRS